MIPSQPEIIARLRVAPSTTRELVDHFTDERDDRRAVEKQIEYALLKASRAGSVEGMDNPFGGRKKLWNVTEARDAHPE